VIISITESGAAESDDPPDGQGTPSAATPPPGGRDVGRNGKRTRAGSRAYD